MLMARILTTISIKFKQPFKQQTIMTTFFIIKTVAAKAIDNVTIYGKSIYSNDDTMRLIKAHCKYPVVVEFPPKILRPEEGKSYSGLKTVLDMLDAVVLHEKKTTYTEVFDGYEQLDIKPTELSRDKEYCYLDLTGGDFKRLKCDRTAMLAENRAVYEVMSFLFKHGCEFEYDGSRAKLRIPLKHFCNRYLTIWRDHLTVHSHHVEKHEEIVEVETI